MPRPRSLEPRIALLERQVRTLQRLVEGALEQLGEQDDRLAVLETALGKRTAGPRATNRGRRSASR